MLWHRLADLCDFLAHLWWDFGPGRVYVWWKTRVTS